MATSFVNTADGGTYILGVTQKNAEGKYLHKCGGCGTELLLDKVYPYEKEILVDF